MEQDSKIKAFYARLSLRERRLLVVWIFAMMGILLFIVSVQVNSAIEDRRVGIERYESALKLIRERQDEYLASQGGSAGKSLEERIATNEIKLQTFLDKEATRFDLKIGSFKEQSLPVGGKRKDKKPGGLMEESVTIEIDNADYNNFSRFLDKIHKSKELIVIKRLDVAQGRKRDPQTKTQVRITMTVSTFKKESS